MEETNDYDRLLDAVQAKNYSPSEARDKLKSPAMRSVLPFLAITVVCAWAAAQNSPTGSSSNVPSEITFEVTKTAAAEYPAAAVAKRIEGPILVSVIIATGGGVTNAQADDGNPALKQAAIAAARQYQISCRKGDQHTPVKCWAELSFDFQLPEHPADPLLIKGSLVHIEEFPGSMLISEPVMKARILRKIEPVYGKAALKAKLQGTVVLDLRIDAAGAVKAIHVLSGPSELANPMADAVRQWEFQPYEFLGEPIEVETRFKWDIELNSSPVAVGTPEDAQTILWLATPRGVKRGSLLYSLRPPYPEIAKQKGVRGPVLVAIAIGKDGAVRNATVIRGDRLLAAAAETAVKQWRYAPSTLNGQPVEVHDIVTVEFQ